MKTAINKRLLVCSELVRDGAVLADVGTDHAYLPIYLLECGKIERAVLSDINQGPLNKARENSEKAGFIHNVELCLCNGASELKKYGATDYAICGMGGELIADIIEHAPHLKDKNVNLILQPMSRANLLRKYLTENGFEILGETLSRSGKIYQTIHARFSGKKDAYNEEELLLGRYNVEHTPPLFADFVAHELQVAKRVLQGKEQSASASTEEDKRMIEILTKRLESLL